MRGDGIVTLLVCISLLTGIVVGLRFNVKFLFVLCLTALVGGGVSFMADYLPFGAAALHATVSLVALQVGYFVAVVITAMRLTEEPIAVQSGVTAKSANRDALGARHT